MAAQANLPCSHFLLQETDGTVCNITKHDWYTIHDL
jgi:hypothetical protein